MATPFETLYTVIQTMMGAVATASPEAITLAPENDGTDFLIAAGNSSYQIQIAPAADVHRGTVKYPRADVEILIHHYKINSTDQNAFLHQTMSHATDKFLARSMWVAESGVYGLETGTEPQISEPSEVGKVTSFSITATVLMVPV